MGTNDILLGGGGPCDGLASHPQWSSYCNTLSSSRLRNLFKLQPCGPPMAQLRLYCYLTVQIKKWLTLLMYDLGMSIFFATHRMRTQPTRHIHKRPARMKPPCYGISTCIQLFQSFITVFTVFGFTKITIIVMYMYM